jgi:hypothetical protein
VKKGITFKKVQEDGLPMTEAEFQDSSVIYPLLVQYTPPIEQHTLAMKFEAEERAPKRQMTWREIRESFKKNRRAAMKAEKEHSVPVVEEENAGYICVAPWAGANLP